MAVEYECGCIFVKVSALAKKYPGGLDAIMNSEKGPGWWHDGQIMLYCSAMEPMSLFFAAEDLKKMGLREGRDFGGFDAPWVEINPDDVSGGVGLVGAPTGRLIGAGNFEEFCRLPAHKKSQRLRGTAVIRRENAVLLVREHNKQAYSLPGGTLKKSEPAISGAVREVYEELGLTATQAIRRRSADFDGSTCRHLVCELTISEHSEPRCVSKEIDDWIWYTGEPSVPVFGHVKAILRNL